MIQPGRVIFRADGDSRMGLGHVIRSKALADTIRSKKTCILYTRCTVPAVLDEVRKTFSDVIILPQGQDEQQEAKDVAASIHRNDIVVLDGYHFREQYQEAMLAGGAALVSVDDIHAFAFRSTIVINSAGGLTPLDYKAYPWTQFYLGPRYTLLRPAFFRKANERQQKPRNKDIFICLGGADPHNTTHKVLEQAAALSKFEKYKIVTGGGYLFSNELGEYVKTHAINAEIFRNVTEEEMADIMSHCYYAICSPSTVSYEFMTVGGVLYLQQIADNQHDMFQFLTREKVAFPLSEAGNITAEEEESSLSRQALLFDGKAGERLGAIFNMAALSKEITVRKAGSHDMMRCYEWANDPAVRDQSFNSGTIALEDHEKWFAAKLSDPQSFYYILEWEDAPFAQIRFQINNDNAVLSYLVDKEYRSRGLGTLILSKGIEAFVNDWKQAVSIHGFVKFSNIASQRSFEKLMFHKSEAAEYQASFKYTMTYDGNYVR